MSVQEKRLEALLRKAPTSLESLFELLHEGLGWPELGEPKPEEVLHDWTPEEFHLDPAKLASLTSVRQIPPLVTGQKFGVFVLDFEGDRLPIGAIRRLVGKLARKHRASANAASHPVWDLEDLLFFCQTSGAEKVLHIVAMREQDGKRLVRTVSWSSDLTQARMDLLVTRAVPDLHWSTTGPSIAIDPSGFSGYRESIKTSKALASRMATVAQEVRGEVESLFEVETTDGPIRTLFSDIKRSLMGDLTPQRFANVYAQTMVYGLLTARISHPEQFTGAAATDVMKFDNPFLDAIYARFHDNSEGVVDVDELGLAELADELAAADMDLVLADFGAKDRRDDPVVHLYEDFLQEYDPDERRRLGAYYTPVPVVTTIVGIVDYLIKNELGLIDGIASATTWGEYAEDHPEIAKPDEASPSDLIISMVDPATGTGTFLLEWLRQFAANRPGEAPPLSQIAALELSPASYTVAHLKTSLELPASEREEGLPIYLADTLSGVVPHTFDGMSDPVADEAARADHVKFDRRASVVIGNPPYERVTKDSGTGGWITHPESGNHSLFDDILDPAKQNTIFSHQASLYNQYVYFWRWSLWKAFEQNSNGPAVVSFITASSWLTGPGFLGLRQLARELADDIWVIDLGGDNHGAVTEENIFPIETPVAIVTLLRRGVADHATPAVVRYCRVSGSREEKLNALADFDMGVSKWAAAPSGWHEPLVPITGSQGWQDHPLLTRLLPWQQPGCMYNRTWPIAPSLETLTQRWSRFIATDDLEDRALCFVTSRTGRNIGTRVADLPRLSDLPVGAKPRSILRYGFRSFDRQFAFFDPRLAKTESPSLWASLTSEQVFLVSKPTEAFGMGPAASVFACVPDKHAFNGRGGKDVFPLFRDAAGTPNVDPVLLAVIRSAHRELDSEAEPLKVEDLFAYCFAILAGADYTERFRVELETPGPRVPLTADSTLFGEVASFGRHLIWLQTFGERFRSPGGPSSLAVDPEIKWKTTPTRIPRHSKDFSYDEDSHEIVVADGRLSGVSKEVWDFQVSGMQILKKWLGYRTAKGAGRAVSSESPLDHIRPDHWSDSWSVELAQLVHVLQSTLNLVPTGIELLDRVLAGPLISADQLPDPPQALRDVPVTPSTPFGGQTSM